jgi:hypothetical protein
MSDVSLVYDETCRDYFNALVGGGEGRPVPSSLALRQEMWTCSSFRCQVTWYAALQCNMD